MKKKVYRNLVLTSTLALLSLPVVAMGASNMVTDIALSPDTPNLVKGGATGSQNVNITFKYVTNQQGGVRIFARPYTDNNLSIGYAACPSPLYSFPSGSGTCFFTITNTNTNVDSIRFQMWNATQNIKLFEGFIPVSYKFR